MSAVYNKHGLTQEGTGRWARWIAVGLTFTPQQSLIISTGRRYPLWRLSFSINFGSRLRAIPTSSLHSCWIPQYLKSVHGFTLRQIGETAWIPFMTAAIGNMAGGAVFSVLLRFKTSPAMVRRIAILLFSVIMACAIGVGKGSATECMLLISLATFGYAGTVANVLALSADVFPETMVASIWGFASMGSGFGGMLFSLLTGWIVERYSYHPVFILFGIVPIIAAWLVWTLPRTEDLAFES